MRIFISGGAKNGKSNYAQNLAVKMENGNGLYYVATMIAADKEDRLRIKKHRADRHGLGFETLEIKADINTIEQYSSKASYLIDSTTALLSNEMFAKDKIIHGIHKKISQDFNFLDTHKNVVIVSDNIYSDAFLYDELTNEYRFGLAYIDKIIASKCDIVIEVVFGNIIVYKGQDLFKELACEFY